MKALVLAGLLSAALAPSAFAAETSAECGVDDDRRMASSREVPLTSTQSQTVRDAQAARDVRCEPTRRRVGKPIPDAELIAPRALL
ncbi:MAG: hypothetical protein JNM59_08400 [Hyphomonadaceae bacterium]|nr:hypothetical protein [Hyphomonadaceae bacterium]